MRIPIERKDLSEIARSVDFSAARAKLTEGEVIEDVATPPEGSVGVTEVLFNLQKLIGQRHGMQKLEVAQRQRSVNALASWLLSFIIIQLRRPDEKLRAILHELRGTSFLFQGPEIPQEMVSRGPGKPMRKVPKEQRAKFLSPVAVQLFFQEDFNEANFLSRADSDQKIIPASVQLFRYALLLSLPADLPMRVQYEESVRRAYEESNQKFLTQRARNRYARRRKTAR